MIDATLSLLGGIQLRLDQWDNESFKYNNVERTMRSEQAGNLLEFDDKLN